MQLYNDIFKKNKEWIDKKKSKNPFFFKELAQGQNPEILYIGCSDSRVTAEEMTGVNPGQMFVHRNIGNLVPNNDLNSASVIEYAINHLKVKHVVVCGHYFCGGVKAAMEAKDLGILNPWLRTIRDVYRMHSKELNAIDDETLKYKRLVELNTEEQCINIIKMATWQKHYLDNQEPTIHGWVFDIERGKLIDLHFDFAQKLKDIQEIYDLGTQK